MFRTLVTGVAAFLLDMLVLWVLTEYVGLYYLVSGAVSALIAGLSLGVNIAAMWLFTDIVGLYYMVSKVAAQIISFLFNFFLRKLYVFEGGVGRL